MVIQSLIDDDCPWIKGDIIDATTDDSSANTSYPPPSVLSRAYEQSKKKFNTDSDFASRVHAVVLEMQKGERSNSHEISNAWKHICAASRKGFEKIFQRLDVKVTERGESHYKDLLDDVCVELISKNIAEVYDGALVVFPEGMSRAIS